MGFRPCVFNVWTLTVCVCACGPQYNVKLSQHPQSETKAQVTGFSTPASLRLAFLREPQSLAVYCAEPMPDVALGSETSASGSLAANATAAASASGAAAAVLADENQQLRKQLDQKQESSSSTGDNLNLQGAYKLAVSVSELQGRTQHVLLAREFLYRLCEARANRFFVDDKAYVTLQNNALKLIESIATAQSTPTMAQRVEELKAITAFTKQQSELCKQRNTACTEAAGKKEDELAKCKAEHVACLGAIKAPEPSKPPGPAEKPSNLATPEIETKSTLEQRSLPSGTH